MTERERLQVELLRLIVETEEGAAAIVRHLGKWFQDFCQEWTKTE